MIEVKRQRFDHEEVLSSLGLPFTLEEVEVTKLNLEKVFKVREPSVDRVKDLASAYAAGDDVPPIVVADDRATVIDGGHRVTAVLRFHDFIQEQGKKPPSKLPAYVLQVSPGDPLIWWYVLAFNLSPKDGPVPLKFSNISRALKEYFLHMFEVHGKDSEEIDGIVKEVKRYVKKYGWPPQVVDNAYDAAIAEVIFQVRREKAKEETPPPVEELLPSPEVAKKVIEKADEILKAPKKEKPQDDPATIHARKLGMFISSVLELWRKWGDLKVSAVNNGMSEDEASVMFWFHAKGRGISDEVYNALLELSEVFSDLVEYGRVS